MILNLGLGSSLSIDLLAPELVRLTLEYQANATWTKSIVRDTLGCFCCSHEVKLSIHLSVISRGRLHRHVDPSLSSIC